MTARTVTERRLINKLINYYYYFSTKSLDLYYTLKQVPLIKSNETHLLSHDLSWRLISMIRPRISSLCRRDLPKILTLYIFCYNMLSNVLKWQHKKYNFDISFFINISYFFYICISLEFVCLSWKLSSCYYLKYLEVTMYIPKKRLYTC